MSAPSAGTDENGSIKASIDTSVIEELKKAVGGDIEVTITIGAIQKAGAKAAADAFTVTLNSRDLDSKLKVYDVTNAKSQSAYVIVNANIYKVENGSLDISLSKGRDYRLVGTKDAASIDTAIKATVAPAKTSKNLKVGKKSTFALTAGANTASIKSIAYTSTNEKVAGVDANGSIKAHKKGSASIDVTVTFNDGSAKDISLGVSVSRYSQTVTVKASKISKSFKAKDLKKSTKSFKIGGSAKTVALKIKVK